MLKGLKIYEEYVERVGDISGYVRRIERNDIIVDLGTTEAVIPYKEQVPTERYRPKDRIQAYVMDVKRSSRGPQVIMSRGNPGFLVKLFAQHVTEIYDDIVSIESASRDPGYRSKIAVYSRDSSVDPVGACVGLKGARVQAVVSELNGEKIDIVPYDQDPARLVVMLSLQQLLIKLSSTKILKAWKLLLLTISSHLAIGKKEVKMLDWRHN